MASPDAASRYRASFPARRDGRQRSLWHNSTIVVYEPFDTPQTPSVAARRDRIARSCVGWFDDGCRILVAFQQALDGLGGRIAAQRLYDHFARESRDGGARASYSLRRSGRAAVRCRSLLAFGKTAMTVRRHRAVDEATSRHHRLPGRRCRANRRGVLAVAARRPGTNTQPWHVASTGER